MVSQVMQDFVHLQYETREFPLEEASAIQKVLPQVPKQNGSVHQISAPFIPCALPSLCRKQPSLLSDLGLGAHRSAACDMKAVEAEPSGSALDTLGMASGILAGWMCRGFFETSQRSPSHPWFASDFGPTLGDALCKS